MGKKYVWTERDQVDEDLVCESCGAVNDPDNIDCHDCERSLLTVDDDTEWLDQQTTEVTPRSEVANKAFNASAIDAIYRELCVLKGGLLVVGKSIAVVSSLLISFYLLYRGLQYFNITDIRVMVVGVVGCFLLGMWAWGDGEADLGMFE